MTTAATTTTTVAPRIGGGIVLTTPGYRPEPCEARIMAVIPSEGMIEFTFTDGTWHVWLPSDGVDALATIMSRFA